MFTWHNNPDDLSSPCMYVLNGSSTSTTSDEVTRLRLRLRFLRWCFCFCFAALETWETNNPPVQHVAVPCFVSSRWSIRPAMQCNAMQCNAMEPTNESTSTSRTGIGTKGMMGGNESRRFFPSSFGSCCCTSWRVDNVDIDVISCCKSSLKFLRHTHVRRAKGSPKTCL